ncbi:hypothetical protein QAD02_014608 [Eretmocerus hayati]|uniref:Uncharacterized protein n=1 Tax=Eretmocerus hayati TaxID=131215 RepID=A0ACC2P7H3_9HYME|nr:hypothetical protein QAD02_014608 [Eretmocerus hayati]
MKKKSGLVSPLHKIQQSIKECTKKPEAFLSVQEQTFQDLKCTTKDLYDLAVKGKSSKSSKSSALPELIVEGFDTEQIWQQLELENNEEFSRFSLGKLSKILAKKDSLVLPWTVDQDVSVDNQQQNPLEESELSNFDTDSNDEEQSQESDPEKEVSLNGVVKNRKIKKKRRNTEVDDRFFKLDDCHEFLNKEDRKALNIQSRKSEESDEDEGSIDLFNDVTDSEKGEDGDLKYADFFDEPEHSDDEEMDSQGEDSGLNVADESDESNCGSGNNDRVESLDQNPREKKKRVKFDLLNDSDDSGPESAEEMDLSGQASKSQNAQSSLEIRQERLKKRIKQLEEESISQKPWQLMGETSASSRPQNSLLEEFVEFDTVSRPAPIMTEQTTMKLEDIIKGRIKDKTWDDVEKKFKPVETPMEYKKKLIMNQEKSKESLAQIYENEYVQQREALLSNGKEPEKEEPPEHIEIRERMHSLFRKLDALSNFHYTPKPAKPEIKIVSNVSAVTMEEVAPIATSDATLLAPEEVKSKQKGDLIGKSERSKTDKKRERRKKKLRQHSRALNESKKSVESGKQIKSLKNKILEKKLTGRNIIHDDGSTSNQDKKALKSSTAFFSQLQDQVKSSIKSKTANSAPKKNKDALSAKKLKL